VRRLTQDRHFQRVNLIVLMIFGVAFGFVEAAVVYYLRALGDFHQNYVFSHYRTYLNLGFITFVSPIQTLLVNHRVSVIEVTREAATIVMLATVAYVAARTWKARCGAFLVAFGCWDLAYYLFLRIEDNWPRSLFTKDVFFLIPVTWIGPVITPIVLSFVIIVLGAKLYTD
jgi:hypothetical protein